MASKDIIIVGAGLCGSLLSVMLAKRGIRATVFERREDPRKSRGTAGRSINLAMSARGLRALERAGLVADIRPHLLPMRGRLIHHRGGGTELQPYGQREHEQIFSVSRSELNRLLVTAACDRFDVDMRFGLGVRQYAADGSIITVENIANSDTYEMPGATVIAADGAGSVFRRAFPTDSYISPAEFPLAHGYKELAIPAGPGGRFQLEPGALHIWPRGDFMLIALPNPGGDFTLTLFLPNSGPDSFESLDSSTRVLAFFEQHFADAVPLIPDLAVAFAKNPTGMLGTVRCRHWHVGSDLLLLGDAAHAIVPFHGQGMNLAFEDCVVLDDILADDCPDWGSVFREFESRQHENANAIADMALENYVEMRDTVRDPKFLLRKALAFELERRMPEQFIPRYSMVMFHPEIPYAEAQRRGAVQQAILEELSQNAQSIDDIDLDSAERLVTSRLQRDQVRSMT